MVTFLVTEVGLELTRAGVLFSIVQVTGIFGRILLGGVADRLGSAASTLCGTAIASALTTAAFAAVTPGWSFGALAALSAVCGVTVSSWNGLMPRSELHPDATVAIAARTIRTVLRYHAC